MLIIHDSALRGNPFAVMSGGGVGAIHDNGIATQNECDENPACVEYHGAI